MVFEKGKSLNKALFTGPDLLNNLVDVLLQFRNHKIALVRDMEAMFHQVILTKCVSIFGATDSPCCANFGVKYVTRDNKEKCNRVASESILKSFYADDLLKSVI